MLSKSNHAFENEVFKKWATYPQNKGSWRGNLFISSSAFC